MIVVLVAGESRAAPAPSQLRGKSVIVSWTEHRSQRQVGKPDFKDRTVRHELKIYVSTEGRAFSRLTNTNRRGSGSNEQVADGDTGRRFNFTDRTATVLWGGSIGGARRIAVDFDSSFGGCSADVIRAKEVGGSSIISRSLISGKTVEIRSVSVSGVTCAIRSGNVFGGE